MRLVGQEGYRFCPFKIAFYTHEQVFSFLKGCLSKVISIEMRSRHNMSVSLTKICRMIVENRFESFKFTASSSSSRGNQVLNAKTWRISAIKSTYNEACNSKSEFEKVTKLARMWFLLASPRVHKLLWFQIFTAPTLMFMKTRLCILESQHGIM